MRGSRAYVCARVRKRREGEKREEKDGKRGRKKGRKEEGKGKRLNEERKVEKR